MICGSALASLRYSASLAPATILSTTDEGIPYDVPIQPAGGSPPTGSESRTDSLRNQAVTAPSNAEALLHTRDTMQLKIDFDLRSLRSPRPLWVRRGDTA